jgi:chemosensory pili system protein ChpB (putative protein-glutamate methylesterase)
MTVTERPRVGILSDSPLQRHVLQHAISSYGLEIALSCDPARFGIAQKEELDNIGCWILELENEDDLPDLIDTLLDSTDAGVLFGLGKAPERQSDEYPRWERRLFSKLRDEIGTLEVLDSEASLDELGDLNTQAKSPLPLPSILAQAPAKQALECIWILAASLGGPAAVKDFLDQLPAGLPVSFIYAQHIDANFSSVLSKVLARHSSFQLKEAQEGDKLESGQVLMVPVDREMILDEQGKVQFKDSAWPGPYGPSIDQVMINIANHYGSKCNVMVFSGMGNDGAIAAPLLKAYGCNIWVQSADSCANSSMPDSVEATGCSSFTGNPVQLAAHLITTIEQETILSGRNTPPQAGKL